MGEINGVAIGSIAAGAIFVYGGIVGKSPLAALRAVVQGSSPASAPTTQDIPQIPPGEPPSFGPDAANPGTQSAGIASGLSPQAALQTAAARYGWDKGPQWTALTNIEMNEAGFNPRATNPTSQAFGLAQALDHGTAKTQGTLSNMYGGFGLTTAQAVAANSGDPGTQALWMVNYIRSRYTNPVNAWAKYHHADGSNWY